MPCPVQIEPSTLEFYREAMRTLQAAGVPFLVGGAYALERYTGISRQSKDIDLFLAEPELPHALAVLDAAGCRTETPFPHWLAKAWKGDDFVDLIYGSGNGVALVDDLWFQHSVPAEVLGVPVRLIPVEEMIWSKGFLMERERFDGADVAHLMHARAERIDWDRMIARFAGRWRVLFAHLILFGYVYPGERQRIPSRVMRVLARRLGRELGRPDPKTDGEPVCRGTLLSREQYLHDLGNGYRDGRIDEDVMDADEIEIWTRAIEERSDH